MSIQNIWVFFFSRSGKTLTTRGGGPVEELEKLGMMLRWITCGFIEYSGVEELLFCGGRGERSLGVAIYMFEQIKI